MTLRTEDELHGREVTLIFIARNLREARKVERLLDDRSIDYTISLEPFSTGIFSLAFGGPILGAHFWAVSSQAETGRVVLRHHGLRRGIVDEPEEA